MVVPQPHVSDIKIQGGGGGYTSRGALTQYLHMYISFYCPYIHVYVYTCIFTGAGDSSPTVCRSVDMLDIYVHVFTVMVLEMNACLKNRYTMWFNYYS